METSHTPGPWSHRNGRVFQTDWDVLTIANVARAFDGDYSPANGRLIAAAPELLDALNAILATKPQHGMNPNAKGSDPMELKVSWNVHLIARAAIAMATGEAV